MKDDNCGRNEWKAAKIVDTYPDEKGFVRTVKILVGSVDRNGIMDSRTFVRPVDKLVLLVEADEIRSPTREPWVVRSQDISWLSWEEPVVYGLGSHIGSHIGHKNNVVV